MIAHIRGMLRLTPIILILLYAAAMWFFSQWRMRRELDANSVPLDHPRLRPVLARFGEVLDLPAIRAHVYEVDPVNGLAAPDGRVFLTRGFIRKLDSGEVTEAELASVIAHELGHLSLGHTKRRFVDFAGQNVIRTVLAGVLGRFVPIIGVWIANLAATAIAMRLSRQDEFEADAWASALMLKSGYGVAPQISLFRKLDAMTGRRAGGTPAWMLSHPPTDQRIAAIEARNDRWVKGDRSR